MNDRPAVATSGKRRPPPLRARPILASTALALLAGCASLAPEYEQPVAPVPQSYASAVGASTPGREDLPPWRDYFTDPLLQRLIETALGNNRDLRVAALRAEEARAAFQIQRADQFPGLGLGAQGARARVPGDLNYYGQSVVGGEYRAEVGLSSWELDLWGRLSAARSAAEWEAQATEEDRRALAPSE